MLKSRPLFLIVVTLCLLTVAVASYWVALLPQRTLRALKAQMFEETGDVLDAKQAKLDVANGFGITLEDVTISHGDVSPWQLTARSVSLPGVAGGNTVVRNPTIDVDITTFKAANIGLPEGITIVEGVLKLRDPARLAVLAVTDINGEITTVDGKGLRGDLAMVWGSQVSDLSFNIDDVERFGTTGSPADWTLKSKAMLLAFSGQARADIGLKLAGEISATASDIGASARWMGMPFQALSGGGAMLVESPLETSGLALTFTSLAGTVGDTKVKGRLTVEAGADRNKLTGDVGLSALSLWGPNTGSSVLAKPWSEKPLSFGDFSVVDFDLTLTTERLDLQQRNFGAIFAQLKSNADDLAITLPEQKIVGGTGSLNATLKKAGAGFSFDTAFDVKSAQAKMLLGGLLGFELLDGAIDMNASLKSSGQNLAALISTLQGQVKLSSKDSVISTDLQAPLGQPQKGWNAPDSAKTERLTFNLVLSFLEGVGTLTSSAMTVADIALKPQGEIDLLRQALSVQLAPKGRNIDPKMAVIGPWVMPEFAPADLLKEKAPVTPPAN